GSELDVGELLDVLDQRVAVLGSVGEADQDQHRRLADPAQHVLPGLAVLSAHGCPPSYYVGQYISQRSNSDKVNPSGPPTGISSSFSSRCTDPGLPGAGPRASSVALTGYQGRQPAV